MSQGTASFLELMNNHYADNIIHQDIPNQLQKYIPLNYFY